jgi:hypothetical protein
MSQEPEVEPNYMFDEKLDNKFRTVIHSAFLEVPELRSVIVVYDYYRNLNDIQDIGKGMWLSAEGGKEKPIDSVVGSFGALLQSAAHILDEMFQRHQTLLNELTRVSKELLEKQNALQK